MHRQPKEMFAALIRMYDGPGPARQSRGAFGRAPDGSAFTNAELTNTSTRAVKLDLIGAVTAIAAHAGIDRQVAADVRGSLMASYGTETNEWFAALDDSLDSMFQDDYTRIILRAQVMFGELYGQFYKD